MKQRIYLMIRAITVLALMCVSTFVYALNLPVEGIKPGGRLPVLYVNTANAVPIDQKETYIDAEWWLDATGTEFESIGSESEPHKAGIRGRGNTTWRHDGQKPYKLKTDKKEKLLGMKKNKHWALLARVDNRNFFNEFVGMEIGRRIGIDFVPEQKPIDLVVNGTYYGMYILSETVRVDENRVNIIEQPENATDPDVISKGWLVELDNNLDPYQVRLPLPDGRTLNVTHKSPEITSPEQDAWLTNEFQAIIAAVSNPNKLDREWERYFDLESLAKFLVVQELIHNWDAFSGSCYMSKNDDEKWHFSTLWDLSFSLSTKEYKLIAEHSEQKLIGDIYKFPRFKKILKAEYDKFMATQGIDWVKKYMDDYLEAVAESAVTSGLVWPYQELDAEEGLALVYDSFQHYTSNLDNRYGSELKVSTLSTQMKFYVLENGEKVECKEDIPACEVLYNGMNIEEAEMALDTEVEVSFVLPEDCTITKVMNGDSDITSLLTDNKIVFDGLESDATLMVECVVGDTSVEDIFADSDIPTEIFTIDGLHVAGGIDSLAPGIYILRRGATIKKIVVK